jgi:hypothetical protein
MKSTVRTKNKMNKAGGNAGTGQEGICPSCENVSRCGFRHHSRGSVFFCEDFTSGFSQAIPPVYEKGPGGKAAPDDREKLTGICNNCDHAKACLYPKGEAGIWHCEEYC